MIQHKGSSVNKARQTAPHAHSIDLDASGKLAVAADLGLDKLMVYRFDPEAGDARAQRPALRHRRPGLRASPLRLPPRRPTRLRHQRDGLDRDRLRLRPLARDLRRDSRPSRPEAPGGRPGNSTAEILVHPSGKFVYGSNRGDDSLAIFAVEPTSGKLTLVGHQPTGGRTPRNFGIDPTGQFVLAANQDSDTVVVFRVDPGTGLLKQVGEPVAVPSPVCVKFVPIGE